MSQWHYYNHALIPNTHLRDELDANELNNKHLWKQKPKPLLARWTTDFDCGYETNWWYCIKDNKFDINSVKAKIRYYIKKGISNFDVKIIDSSKYKEELYKVQVAAFSAYPDTYRPAVEKENFLKGTSAWSEKYVVFGAFEKENGTLQGYSLCHEHDRFVELNVQKTNPAYEKLQINAALVNEICEVLQRKVIQRFLYHRRREKYFA